MAKNITLYFHPRTCAIVPHILLHQAKLPFTSKLVDVGDLASSEIAEKNPKQQIPVLIVDENTITEVPAVVQAINQLAPDRQLMGKDSLEFIRVCEWMNYFSASIHAQAWGPYARPWRFIASSGEEVEAGIRTKAVEKLQERFDLIEWMLGDVGWAVGNAFTAADPYFLLFFRLGKQHQIRQDMDESYPKWAKLVHNLHQMDSVKKVLSEYEQLGGVNDSYK